MAAACVADGEGGAAAPQEPEAPAPAPAPTIAGRYHAETALPVPVLALVPGSVADGFDLLADLRAEPANTLVGLFDEAGVPLVDELLGALPTALHGKFLGWIDSAVDASLAGGDRGARFDQVLALVDRSLGTITLEGTLDVGAVDAGGACLVTHDLTALRFGAGEVAISVPLAGAPAPAVTSATVTGAVTMSQSGPILALGEHRFGLAFGVVAWRAIELGAAQTFGHDLRTELGAIVDCAAVGEAVARRCVLGVCVGHGSDVTAICEAGLDEAVATLRGRVEAIDFDVVTLADGRAVVTGPGQAQAQGMTGTFAAELDLGQGARAVAATLSAHR